MKVLVTGANGLLGHHVVMQLQKAHHDIRIILRGSRDVYFDMTNVESVGGNFTDYDSLKIAADGCYAIIHIAAVTATDLRHYEDYRKINVEGAANVIKVANELNINRLVFVSTANTIGYGSEKQLATEDDPMAFPFSKSFYARSKVEAEMLFKEASRKPDRHVIIIHPTFMIGAYDTKPSSGKLMLMAYRKRIMFAPSGGKNFVATSDVASAVCNALTEGKNGEHYLISGINLSFKEFYLRQSSVGRYPQKLIVLPDFILEIAGKAGDFIRLLGIKTDVCSMNIHQLLVREYYSNKKAVTELKMPQKSLDIAILDALDWFRINKKF